MRVTVKEIDGGFASTWEAGSVAPVDGYDVSPLEAMATSGVTQVLTDDGDFCCVAGVEVFTANPRVLGAARAQGRLVVR